MQKIIEASDINMSFGDVKALRNISFDLKESDIIGFIGPDGAGKTTLFRIIATLLIPDEGELKVLGLDSVSDYKELRKKQLTRLYTDTSVDIDSTKALIDSAKIYDEVNDAYFDATNNISPNAD